MKTAVEWLCEKYHLKQDVEIVNQAKEMEKEQIIDAYETDMSSCGEFRNGLDYYNEKFNKDENK